MLDYYLFKQVYDLMMQGRHEEGRRILADLQSQYIELSDENSLLRSQIQEYEDVLYLAKNLDFDGLSYWLTTGSIKQGPFCRTCYEQDGLLMRLHEHNNAWRCLTCGSSYERQRMDSVGYEPQFKPQSPKVIPLFK